MTFRSRTGVLFSIVSFTTWGTLKLFLFLNKLRITSKLNKLFHKLSIHYLILS